VVILGEDKVAAERPRGQRRRLPNVGTASADQVSVTMPRAPAFETAAASRGIAAMGAWTIGCSIPSNSHTGVRTAFAPSGRFAGH
jgi:hypothetical protein